MRWKVLISAPYMQPVLDEFRPIFAENSVELIVPQVKEHLEEKDLLEIIEDIDGVICGDDRFTKNVMTKAKKLKVIAKWGTGIDSIDREEAKRLGIAVHNTPNAFTHPVADSVLAYILSFARRTPWTASEMRAGKWIKKPCVALRETTLGVIGVGNIGKAVIHRALAFDMKVLGNDIVEIDADFLRKTGCIMVNKEELLKQADFVSLNCDLNPTSSRLLSEKEFSLMKNSAYLINTARGPIVDEKALIKALRKKLIAGAALDVFEFEPLPKSSPLRKMDNCLLAPHNSNSSPAAWERVHHSTIKNLLDELKKRG